MVIKLDVAVPDTLDSLEPIELIDRMSSLRAAFVERYAISSLKRSEWDKDTKGFYVLLSHINTDNTFTAYVGQTDYSFERRLREHNKTKDYWNLAVLFKRDNEVPFNRSETRFLEGAMVNALQSSPNVQVTNDKATGEDALSDWEKPYMEQVLLAALRVLFLRGYRNSHLGAITRNLEEQTKLTIPAKRQILNPTLHSSEEELYDKLHIITLDIKNSSPEAKASYHRWATKTRLNAIVVAKPVTFEELSKINGVGSMILSRANDIIKLFKSI